MGRIKSTLVKRTSNNLLKEDNKFNGTFDRNKKLLGDSMPSKKVRNKIAGYLARLKRRETKEI
jgi:ribosomal protein S17E